ncbi:hypothetical protein KIY85_gp87 [Mycobacterium phage Heffalump]|uniref:Gp84-like domain-containing protein n=1 Tax=Mycobacterium phage Heffalump TaxID=1983575 RepID=A0A220NSK1_9CAUD|nr:hypothetical protein KIY85_gp87 [Mycobacterium phage Heffalump]ASJ79789.1 hypothetical protein SEA_HEFFALUMP_87 [Mycobacterium phage Heffalump]
MFTIVVTKVDFTKSAEVSGSHVAVVIDHLEASAKRNGFEIVHVAENHYGDVIRDGQIVAMWEVQAA